MMQKPLNKVRFEIKIADLGMAKILVPGYNTTTNIGTDQLYAPEMILKQCYDH